MMFCAADGGLEESPHATSTPHHMVYGRRMLCDDWGWALAPSVSENDCQWYIA